MDPLFFIWPERYKMQTEDGVAGGSQLRFVVFPGARQEEWSRRSHRRLPGHRRVLSDGCGKPALQPPHGAVDHVCRYV